MSQPILEVKDLSKHFGGLKALSNLTQTIHEGDLLGLIGPNGAGKTTVFNVISGFYKPTNGTIHLNGKNIARRRPHQITSVGMARTFQNIRLWDDLTVFENICLAQHSRLGYGFLGSLFRPPSVQKAEKNIRVKAGEILEILELDSYGKEYPKNLPYGMQRRLEIGRALATEPKLLLLDEPAAGMHPGEIEDLIRLIRWVKEQFNLAIWLIEHHMQVVMKLCNKITVLNFGEVLASGTPETIRKDPKVIKAYLGEPTGEDHASH